MFCFLASCCRRWCNLFAKAISSDGVTMLCWLSLCVSASPSTWFPFVLILILSSCWCLRLGWCARWCGLLLLRLREVRRLGVEVVFGVGLPCTSHSGSSFDVCVLFWSVVFFSCSVGDLRFYNLPSTLSMTCLTSPMTLDLLCVSSSDIMSYFW